MEGTVGSSGVFDIEDVPVSETWKRLGSDARAVLVDVRTRAEWAFVGLPDLTGIGKRPVLQEWQTFPDNRVDAQFADKLAALLTDAKVAKDDEIFFICRSGGRSKMAAQALSALGFSRCRNVADGFEGPLDTSKHRGTSGGWKKNGLPWVQG